MAVRRNAIPPFAQVQAAKRAILGGELQRELAAEYDVSEAQMSNIISEVLRKKWLIVTAQDNYPADFNVDHASSKELTRRYDNIETIHVLDLSRPEREYATWSDHVHRELGRYLGEYHVLRAVTTDDRIGVSSGRGVCYTIEGIHPAVLRADNVTLMSLTGSFGNRAHSIHDSTIMDGDTNVGLFGRAFVKMVHLQTTGREVVANPGERRPTWFSEPPNRALVGLGVLEETSRIISKDSMLHGLHADLQDLKILVKAASSDNYIPCADMCNYLLYIPPPKGLQNHKELEIQKLIDKINARLFVIPFESLLKVKGCWLAVGTAKKAHALDYCLRRGLRVSGLCIDKTLAEELLRLSA